MLHPTQKLEPPENQARFKHSKLLAMSGDKNPYPDGPIEEVAVGAYADLLIVDGEPPEDIAVLGELDNLQLIMKKGAIYTNMRE